MKKLYFILFLFLCTTGFSQTLVETVNLPSDNFFNYSYGVIKYSVPQKTSVKLAVYDILGKEVKTLITGEKDADSYDIKWNGLNNNGQSVSTGIYIYRIQAGDFVQERKMILMK